MGSKKAISVLFTFSGGPDTVTTEELDFPTTKEELSDMLSQADAAGKTCIRMSPTFWGSEGTTPIGELTDFKFNEENANAMNTLAAKLSKLDGDDFEKFEAVIESGRHCGVNGGGNGEIADYLNIIDNLDSFTFHRGMDASGYGELLLAGPDNMIAKLIRTLRYSFGKDGEEYADIVDSLRECVDAEEFGQSMSHNNDGDFLDSGYLIEDGGFSEAVYETLDIPAEYRIWEQPAGFIKVANVDLRGLLMEMHALGGNYTQDAAENLMALTRGDSFLIMESKGKLTVLPAAEVFRKDSPDNIAFMAVYEPNGRAFFAYLNETPGSELWGNLQEVDITEMQVQADRIGYGAAGVDVEFKDGTNRLFTPAEWSALSDRERENTAGMVYRYNSADESIVTEYFNSLRGHARKNGCETVQEDFLAALNEPFMAKAQNAQPDMLRIAREAARDMVARGDAEVYRLMPEGAVKLTPMDVIKSNGLWFGEHREFAIKPGGLAGLRKWANRTADEIARQAMRGEQHKSQGQEH